MADSIAQMKKKTAEVMKRMAKKYGSPKLSSKEPDVEQAIYLILREGWDFRKAGRAVKRLQECFVDWNEVRVSYVKELREALEKFTHKDMDGKLKQITEFLNEVFDEYNRLESRIFYDDDFEKTRKFFGNMKSIRKAIAYVFLQCLKEAMEENDDPASSLVTCTESLRVGIRLGLIKKTGSLNVGRKAYAKLLAPASYVEFQYGFVQHGEGLCRSKDPKCKECFLSSICDYFKP